jgi:hypothetical protein
MEKKHLRTGSSSCCSNAWIVARANTAGPEASKFASTANQYITASRCSSVKSDARSDDHDRSAGFHTARLDFS